MPEYTDNLKLFKYNTATDGKEVFSINASMNDNWDKIDAFAAGIKSLSNLDEQGEKRFTDINAELNKKLEADVLLAENGYIKFNNGLVVNFINIGTNGTATSGHASKDNNVTLPCSNVDRIFTSVCSTSNHIYNASTPVGDWTQSTLKIWIYNTSSTNNNNGNVFCIVFGY